MTNEALENLGHEDRRFPPSPEFAAQANATESMYDDAASDRLAFWDTQARRLTWATPWTQTLDWSDAPFAKWFVGGSLNVSVNCLDRHVEAGYGSQVAINFEGEPGDTRTLTYADLLREVSKAANALTELGVEAGDRVMIYLPMIPEAAIAMLACARIGAPHSVVFGGFSAEALHSRIDDADARVVITADGGYRRGSAAALKPAVDEAVAMSPGIEHVLVVRRTGQDVAWTDKDLWWHDVVDRQPETHEAQAFDAEHPLFILYTSGTTARPKGILHTTGGYLTQVAFTHAQRLRPQAGHRRVLVLRRRRLGHRALVHRLRSAGEPGDPGDVRGHAGHPAQGALVGDRREVRRHDPVHRADRDPYLHEVGRASARRVRPLVAAPARIGR